jgi:hypothetical protein
VAVSQLKRLVAGFLPWRSQFVTMAPHVRFVMYICTMTGFVSEQRERLINFCRANLAVYRMIILRDNYRLSLPAATPLHVWAVGWACNFCTINGPTGSGNRQLSDKIMTLYTPIYIHTHIALNLIPTASIWQIKNYSMLTLPPSYAGSVDILGASNSWSSKGLYRPLQGRLACLLNAVHTAWHPI